MGYVADQKSQIHSEFGLMMPRLRSFALALTGDESQAQTLLRVTRHHLLARTAKERGHTPLPLWALMQMQRIWTGRMQGRGAERIDPRLFLPRSRANDAGAARFAVRLSRLSPLQRGALHLVYGERLSYDDVAEIFDVPVSEIITRLAKSHATLADAEQRERSHEAVDAGIGRVAGGPPSRQGWAA